MYDKLISLCQEHFTKEEVELVNKAYDYAFLAHNNQYRKSGEPYIIHPVCVAYYVLSKYHLYDVNAVIASLLHDIIEDTEITWADIYSLFGLDVANLVLNVTNSSNISYKNKNEKEFCNNAMILRNMISDIRTIIIKSSDRFHNMETLEYVDLEHRARKSIQTFGFYVPLNYAIGTSILAQELEDLCFKFMNNEKYNFIAGLRDNFKQTYAAYLKDAVSNIGKVISPRGVAFLIDIYLKSYYKLFKDLKTYHHLASVPNFITMKIIVSNEEDCDKILEVFKSNYVIENVSNSSANLKEYRVINFDIEGFKKYKIHIEIYTKEAHLFFKYGYVRVLNELKDKDMRAVHAKLKDMSSFFYSLNELAEFYCDNIDLITHAEQELLGSKINVLTRDSEIVRMPKDSTVLDFAYHIHTNIGNKALGAYINGVLVPVDYVLQNNDKVDVLCDNTVRRMETEAKMVKTTRARKRILEQVKK